MEERKKKKKTSPVFLIIIIACIGVMAYAAYQIISLQLEYKEGRDEYASLQQYTLTLADPEIPGEDEAGTDQSTSDKKKAAPVKPHMKCPIEVDFASLKEINDDIIGWLYVGAVEISYPIVQGPDNDYYLHRTFMDTYNFAGSIFMEAMNKKDFQDANTILYGHNMLDQSMFGRLKLLTDEEKYKKDPYIWVITPKHTYRYSMFSLHRVSYDGYVYTLFSGPSNLVTEYIEKCESESLVPLGKKKYDAKSKVITLSTCTSSDAERYVAQGLMDQID